MKLLDWLSKSAKDESGAVTVDWVVLTAAIVILGAGVVSVISPGLTSASGHISSVIATSGN